MYTSFFKHVFFILQVMFLCGCASEKKSNQHQFSSGAFFFIQMSDPQFGFFNNNVDFKKETKNFTQAIQLANQLKPAFVVITGDLINLPGDTVQANEYQRIASLLSKDIPLYNVAGNHEMTNEPTPKWINFYEKYFGSNFYSFEYRNFLGIVLNSTIIVNSKGVQSKTESQKVWLENTLKDAQKKRYKNIVIFQHHPWFIKDAEEEDDYWNIPRTVRGDYLSLFEKCKVHHVFAGHLHKNFEAFGKNVDMVTTSAVGRPLGDDPSGFRIVSVHKNGKIVHKYFALDSVPHTIDF